MAVRQIDAGEFEEEVRGKPGAALVDFYATWCPPCRALAPLVERFAEQQGEALKVFKIDTDEAEELTGSFGVRTIPTLIFFRDGQEVRRAVNPQSRAALEALIA